MKEITLSRKISKKGLKKKCHDLWREAVFTRDNYTCQVCGTKYPPKSRGLHPHHIFTKGGYPAFRYELDNGIALCCGHHRGFAHAKPREFDDFLVAKYGQEWLDALRSRANQAVKVGYERIIAEFNEARRGIC